MQILLNAQLCFADQWPASFQTGSGVVGVQKYDVLFYAFCMDAHSQLTGVVSSNSLRRYEKSQPKLT